MSLRYGHRLTEVVGKRIEIFERVIPFISSKYLSDLINSLRIAQLKRSEAQEPRERAKEKNEVLLFQKETSVRTIMPDCVCDMHWHWSTNACFETG
jgi:hypothetical protein